MSRVTASKVGLLAHCQWYARDEAEWVDTAGPAAERGTRFHRAIALYINGVPGLPLSVEDDIAAEFAHAKAWVDLAREASGHGPMLAEVALAWDPATDTAEVLHVTDRDYGKHPGKLCGTADLVRYDAATATAYVDDWKTGDGSSAGPQLRTLAVMVSRAYRVERVVIAALEVTAAGVREVCQETLDGFELDAIAGELQEQLAAVASAEPTPGPHCTELYCPARGTCPSGREVVEQIIPTASLVKHRWELAIGSPEHAVWLLDHARLVEQAAKAVRDAVRAYVPPEGLTLADGSVLREGSREMPRFDKSKAIALLKTLGATDQQIGELTYFYQESSGLRVTKAGAKPKRGKRAAATALPAETRAAILDLRDAMRKGA